jgi:NADPH-dependent 7-cyano-7-deazaguanine reductase QueF
MEIIHETKMTAICPNEGHINNYDVTINVPDFVEVETILEILEDYKKTKIFQEDLTKVLCKQIQSLFGRKEVFIELRGEHLGIMITTRYVYPETRYQ